MCKREREKERVRESVCVCVCVCARERERERERQINVLTIKVNFNWSLQPDFVVFQIVPSYYPFTIGALSDSIHYALSNASSIKCITAIVGYVFQCGCQYRSLDQISSLNSNK